MIFGLDFGLLCRSQTNSSGPCGGRIGVGQWVQYGVCGWCVRGLFFGGVPVFNAFFLCIMTWIGGRNSHD